MIWNPVTLSIKFAYVFGDLAIKKEGNIIASFVFDIVESGESYTEDGLIKASSDIAKAQEFSSVLIEEKNLDYLVKKSIYWAQQPAVK